MQLDIKLYKWCDVLIKMVTWNECPSSVMTLEVCMLGMLDMGEKKGMCPNGSMAMDQIEGTWTSVGVDNDLATIKLHSTGWR